MVFSVWQTLGPLLAAADPAAADPLESLENALRLPTSLDLRRELLAAVVAIVVVAVILPRGRRRLAAWPLALLLLAPLPFVGALLFPESAGAPAAAVLGERFFLLSSLLSRSCCW